MIELVKIKKNKETQEKEYRSLFLDKKDIICLYKDRNGCHVLTQNGYLHNVEHEMEELVKHLEL